MSVIDEIQSAGKNHNDQAISRLVRYALYSMLFVAASGFAVIKTFPDLSLYTPFIPEAPNGLAGPEERARMTAESNAFWANGGTDAACDIDTSQSPPASPTGTF